MSFEEDTELRDLLTQTLESNGSLAKIRAQLRACVFFAFDEDELIQKKQPLMNNRIKTHLASAEGRLMFCIVREFLEYFNLDYTRSVYEPESYMGSDYQYAGRQKLLEELQLNDSVPILMQLIRLVKGGDEKVDVREEIKANGVVMDGNCDRSKIMNETFDVSSPSVEQIVENVETPRSVESLASKDDTYEGTSSLVEDRCLIDLEKSVVKSVNSLAHSSETPKSLLDVSLNNDASSSPPILLLDNSKSDKTTKSSSSSSSKACNKQIGDLPPLQINKSRTSNNDTLLLPSLYNSNNNFFELNDNYEEDFMSGSELSFDHNKQASATTTAANAVEDVKENNSKKDELNNVSAASSVTSEDFDFNSNLDDILKSNDST